MINSLLVWLVFQSVFISLIICFILALKLFFKDMFGGIWEYGIWALLLMRILIPINFSSNENLRMIVAKTNTGVLFKYWLFGIIVIIIYTVIINLVFWIKVKNGSCYCNNEVISLLGEIKEKVGVKTNLTIVQASGTNSPALFGIIRPWLLLPDNIVKHISKQELYYIMLHEVVHLKRMDIVFNWIALIIQTIYWFNPLVWYGMARMRKDRELACDVTVLSVIEPSKHKAYGATLLKVMELFSGYYRVTGMAGVIENKSEIARRLTNITTYKRRKIWQPLTILLLSIFLIISPEKINIFGYYANAAVGQIQKLGYIKPVGQIQKLGYIKRVGYKIKDFLSRPENDIDINKFNLVYESPKAELWLEDKDLPEKSLERLKLLIDTKIPEIERFFGTTVEKETEGYGKIVFFIITKDRIPEPFSCTSRKQDNISIIMIKQRAIIDEAAIENLFFITTTNTFLKPQTSSWIRDGVSYYLAMKMRGGAENLRIMNKNAALYLNGQNEDKINIIGRNVSKNFDSLDQKGVFNVLSASFIYYVEKKIGLNNLLEVIRASNCEAELERVSGKDINFLRNEWLAKLKN